MAHKPTQSTAAQKNPGLNSKVDTCTCTNNKKNCRPFFSKRSKASVRAPRRGSYSQKGLPSLPSQRIKFIAALLPLMNDVYLSLHPPPRGILFCVSRNFLGSRAPPRSIPSSPCRSSRCSRRLSRSFLSDRRAAEKAKQNCGGACTREGQSSSDPSLLHSVSCSWSPFLWCCRPPSPTAGLVLHASEERRGLVSWPCSSSHVARFCSVIISSEALI